MRESRESLTLALNRANAPWPVMLDRISFNATILCIGSRCSAR